MDELSLTPVQIKSITPYLDKVYYDHFTQSKGSVRKQIKDPMRAFAWYWVHNGNNATGASRNAYRGTDKTRDDVQAQRDSTHGYELLTKPYIKEAIELIRKDAVNRIQEGASYDIITKLNTIANYDPLELINLDGTFKFKTSDEVPKHLRCLIVGIDYRGNHIKVILANRQKAIDQLSKIAPDLLAPIKHEFNHKHFIGDIEGNPIGFKPESMTSEELAAWMKEAKERFAQKASEQQESK